MQSFEAQSAADTSTSTDPTFTREQLDWIGRGALLLTIPFGFVLLWALYVLARAAPDPWLKVMKALKLRASARYEVAWTAGLVRRALGRAARDAGLQVRFHPSAGTPADLPIGGAR